MRDDMKLIHRKAVRAVLLTEDQRILLMQVREPGTDFVVWITPGGGIEPSEDAETCLRREILEETGLSQFDIGPHIWYRSHTFEWDQKMYRQKEDFYLVKVERIEPAMQANPSIGELDIFRKYEWWKLEDIIESTDVFAPRSISEHLKSLILNGPPKNPIDAGI